MSPGDLLSGRDRNADDPRRQRSAYLEECILVARSVSEQGYAIAGAALSGNGGGEAQIAQHCRSDAENIVGRFGVRCFRIRRIGSRRGGGRFFIARPGTSGRQQYGGKNKWQSDFHCNTPERACSSIAARAASCRRSKETRRSSNACARIN